MKIANQYINYRYNSSVKYSTTPSFSASCPTETLTHYNIGIMQDGIIGKIKTIKANGDEVFLNVLKHTGSNNAETYSLQDNNNHIIGEMGIVIKKYYNYDKSAFKSDPSHIYVDYLRNLSNPNTPYYKNGLEEYKHIGTRLIQIAQRRSDECLCNGNIELLAKNEKSVLAFYKKLGFVPPEIISRYTNPYYLHLTPPAKEPLSKLYGGL